MKERPILFSGPMVRAILDGRKTQTRRIIKPQPIKRLHRLAFDARALGNLWGDRGTWLIRCPKGAPGDRLWVRETWAMIDGAYAYRADSGHDLTGPGNFLHNWKPSIHMPRAAGRIALEVTGVRVERLQDITEEDAIAEGAELTDELTGTADDLDGSYVKAYSILWDVINGHGSWEKNPWVWAIEFRRSSTAPF